jgi:hypothetical protein
MYGQQIVEFRKKIAQLPREELLEIIKEQNPELIMHINRIEYVFENKLQHLTWQNGKKITGRPVTNEELALLVDQPFEPDQDLTNDGISPERQYQAHIAADPVLWARHFLGAKPRAYQIFMLRQPRLRKILRAGRRLGKSWTMAVKMLHQAYTRNDARILVMGPMKTHVELLFKEVIKLAKRSDVVFDSIEKQRQSPQFYIEFKNGSTISFFTTGMRSGGKADVARGQEAHLIVLDELDYMAPEDLDAIYVMLQKTEEGQAPKELIGASTPTGLRQRFWKWCNSPRFKEFWFPSYCNPNFEKADEDEFREEYGEMSYRHEIEADWGESEDGVYPRKYVDAAFNSGVTLLTEYEEEADFDTIKRLSTYKYELEKIEDYSTLIMGVDWDKYGAGVNIAILEMCTEDCPDPRFKNKIRLMYREEMAKDEFAYHKAVDRIIFLNNLLNPKWIYVDRGAGETQIEMLHKHGVKNPHTGLRKKVKGIAFKSSIEVRDPSTKQIDKKEMKPFMVESQRILFERNQLVFSGDDDDLYLQYISYIVGSTTYTGTPKFEMAGGQPDHAHDAIMLACLAITQHYNELLKSNVARTRAMIAVSNAGMTGMPDPTDGEPDLVWSSQTGYRKNKIAKASNRIKRPMSHGVKMGRTTITRKKF